MKPDNLVLCLFDDEGKLRAVKRDFAPEVRRNEFGSFITGFSRAQTSEINGEICERRTRGEDPTTHALPFNTHLKWCEVKL